MYGLSLCSGIGGIDLGLRFALPEYRTVCYVEKEPYCQDILCARMADGLLDRAPLWDDLTTFDASEWKGLVDVVHGGYPCQPFSTASRGRKTADDLWPQFRRVIRALRPTVVFLENVNWAAFLRSPIDLARLGYDVAGPAEFSAAELGAPFRRRRLFLLAILDGDRELLRTLDAEASQQPSGDGNPWETFPVDLGNSDGIPRTLDRRRARLRALGNAVIPGMAARAWRTLVKVLTERP